MVAGLRSEDFGFYVEGGLKARAIVVPGWMIALKRGKEQFTQIIGNDMPPHVFAIRGDRIEVVAIADQVDRDKGLQAAYILRLALDPDALVLGVDVFFKMGELAETESLRAGELQRGHEAGGKAARGICEALAAYKVDRDGSIEGWTFPYRVEGTRVLWLGDGPVGEHRVTGGLVVEKLREFMAMDPDAHPVMRGAEQIAKELGLSDEEMRYHRSRGVIESMRGKGYQCIDFREGGQ